MKTLMTFLLCLITFSVSAQFGQCLLDPQHYHCAITMQKEFAKLEQRIAELETQRSENPEQACALNCIIKKIGPWNMDTDKQITIQHGLSEAQRMAVRTIHVMIRDDSFTQSLPLNVHAKGGDWDGSIADFVTGAIVLKRRTGGHFDNLSYNSTSISRGWIIFQFE